MGLLNIIRRMALREKLSIREISRRTGLSRISITKQLYAGTIEPHFTMLGLSKADARGRAHGLLEMVGLADQADKFPHQFMPITCIIYIENGGGHPG